MNFKEEIQNQFLKAGWFSGRNIETQLTGINEFPQEIKEFLYEYGDLKIKDTKSNESNVTNILDLDKVNFRSNSIYQSSVINKKLYTVGYLKPDHYMVYMDDESKVYLVGDYYFLMGNTLKEGIENILDDNWDESLEWDPNNKTWNKLNN